MPRSRTLALSRQSEAVSLFRRGETFEQIARAVGFANRGTAHRVVTKAFESRIVEDIDLHRQIEAARLDALQDALWPLMLGGDARAASTILEIIATRSKLLGLMDHPPVAPRMLVDPSLGNAGKATSTTDIERHEVVQLPLTDRRAS